MLVFLVIWLSLSVYVVMFWVFFISDLNGTPMIIWTIILIILSLPLTILLLLLYVICEKYGK
jgi:hypothetical protein